MSKTDSEIKMLLNELFAKYQDAEKLIDELEQSTSHSEKTDLSQKISAVFQEIKLIETDVTLHRVERESRSESVADSNKQIVSQIVNLVKDLIPKLGKLESRIQSERTNLAPQIHEGIKAMQMVSAYSKNC